MRPIRASLLALLPIFALGCLSSSDPAVHSARSCAAPIYGIAPFGVRLVGSGTGENGNVTATVDVYFPKGRAAGEAVVMTSAFYGGSVVEYRVLDDNVGVRNFGVLDSSCGEHITGDLLGPDGGIDADAVNNRSKPSDALDLASAHVAMCPSGEVPAQKIIKAPPPEVDPFGGITIETARPLAQESFESVAAKIHAGPVAVGVGTSSEGLRVVPKERTFSLFSPTTIDLSGLRDVLGAPLGLGSVTTRVPTSVVSDLTFASEPPKGSWVGGPLAVTSGVLRVGTTSSDWEAALALGNPSGKTKLRLRHRSDCADLTGAGHMIRLVSIDGTSVDVSSRCGPTMSDDIVPLPGAGPFVLHFVGTGRYASYPCNLPSRAYRFVNELDELAFE